MRIEKYVRKLDIAFNKIQDNYTLSALETIVY